ncbi:hypothetical protein CTAM01_09520 [Colletotrichum tamarilloi]|uniref:Uncharacterized protein n=1 Tax=Colletotrichum tamarilloi TaxID=1209934 RepID=A0ABQ9R337_9PEZI|nr:uncharacterized protein CTAM01_09520 [Colletotrichum tamarilloi]KAK1493112.1 hypothetical protein CTAM01_09520 [Colletotrichum tamarilloi]
MDFILDSRVPKGGGSSGSRGSSGGSKSSKSSKSKSGKNKYKGGGRVGAAGGGGGGGGGGGFSALPLWARILIIVLIVWFVLFLVSLAFYTVKEHKRKKEGKKFRIGHVLGHALLVSTGLWIPFTLYRKFVSRRREKSGGSGGDGDETKRSAGGTYAKIEEGRRSDDTGTRDSWYAGAGAGTHNDNNNADSKYEPMGYAPHYRSPSPAPPPAAGAAPAPTGAAAEYYMPQPPSQTAPTQHPPQYS